MSCSRARSRWPPTCRKTTARGRTRSGSSRTCRRTGKHPGRSMQSSASTWSSLGSSAVAMTGTWARSRTARRAVSTWRSPSCSRARVTRPRSTRTVRVRTTARTRNRSRSRGASSGAATDLSSRLHQAAARRSGSGGWRADVRGTYRGACGSGTRAGPATKAGIHAGRDARGVFGQIAGGTMKKSKKLKKLEARQQRARGRRPLALQGSISLLTLTALGFAGTAGAQEQAAGTGGGDAASASGAASSNELATVVIVRVRRALETAAEFKKDADTFVDSIDATDLGAFPDKSASDALKRMPGVTVNTLQSNDDSTHPSGEPTNILIRGLTQVRTELNGRDAFSADSARGLNFNDVSPELLSGVDAYKNQPAELIEGGIAGTVNLRTRKPFDQDGRVVTINGVTDYGDRTKHYSYEAAALLSDSFNTRSGRFGYLIDIARSHVISRVESVIDDKIDTYCTGGYGTAAAAIVSPDGSIPCTGNPFGGTGWAFAPDGVRYSRVDYDRHRTGDDVSLQYANDAKTLEVTAEYIDSNYRNAWPEAASHAILDGSYYGTPAFDPRGGSILRPATGTGPLVFGSNGMLQSGVLTQPHGSFFGSSSPNINDAINGGSAVPGVPFVNDCAVMTCTTLQDGLYFQNEARNFA